MPLNVFTQRNFVADFRNKSTFVRKTATLRSCDPPLGDLEATYAVHLRLTGMVVVDVLLVILEPFSLGAFVLSQFTCLTDKQTDGRLYDRQYRACIQCSAVKMYSDVPNCLCMDHECEGHKRMAFINSAV